MNLESKILYIQSSIDEKFRIILNKSWGSENADHRMQIRSFIAEKFSSTFSREQLIKLSDLNWLPQAADGFFSISHCRTLGGVAYSKKVVGFDLEEKSRISLEIIKRISTPEEIKSAPEPEHLWVAKEACFKALSRQTDGLIMVDFECVDWNSHFENSVFSCRIISKKALDFGLNKVFIFSDQNYLFGIYFK